MAREGRIKLQPGAAHLTKMDIPAIEHSLEAGDDEPEVHKAHEEAFMATENVPRIVAIEEVVPFLLLRRGRSVETEAPVLFHDVEASLPLARLQVATANA